MIICALVREKWLGLEGFRGALKGALQAFFGTLLLTNVAVLSWAQSPHINKFAVSSASAVPMGITSGPDGAIWFAEYQTNKIARMTMSGGSIEYGVPTFDSGPWGITSGPDGALWFVEHDGNKIGRITTSERLRSTRCLILRDTPLRLSPDQTARSGSPSIWETG